MMKRQCKILGYDVGSTATVTRSRAYPSALFACLVVLLVVVAVFKTFEHFREKEKTKSL